MNTPDLTVLVELSGQNPSESANAPLSLLLTITNNESAAFRLKQIEVSYVGSPLTAASQITTDLMLSSTQPARWNFQLNDISLTQPFPDAIHLKLFCDGFSDPVSINRQLLISDHPTRNSIHSDLWCGNALTHSEVHNTEATGNLCTHQNRGINNLTMEELLTLPYGHIMLDEKGIITAYNPQEQNLSGKSAAEVVGKNFFTEIALGTKVMEFSDHFAEFIASPQRTAAFKFTFPFPNWPVTVDMAFSKPLDDSAPCRITVLLKKS